MQIPEISIVTPVYRCGEDIDEIYFRLVKVLSNLNIEFEIIFVNDCSPDYAWLLIEKIAKKDTRVKGLNFSRNFGQHQAISAGLDHSKGNWVVVMDCDLQDKPEEIPKLYSKALEGFDVVFGKRITRKDTFFKRIFSKAFYYLLGILTDTKQDSSISNFGIYSRKVVKAVCSMKDFNRYFPSMVRWVGFKSTSIDIDHSERQNGQSSYSFSKLMHLGLNVILSFSDKPLRLTIRLGLGISFFSFILGIIYLVKYFQGKISVLGYASLMISIWFLSGIIIFVLGIIGLYLGKTFEKVKDRPIYIVSDTLNLD